jgi:steroid delta-isomerase-like uncharacterized protein
MSQENIAAARRVIEEAFNKGNLDVIDEVCADNYVDHDPLLGDQDRDAAKQSIASYREAFPDLNFTIDDVFAADDHVVMRWTGTGTFENPLMGLEPNHSPGQPIHGIGIDRFEDGKVVESWSQWDTLQFMRDIGAIPSEAGAPAA